MKHVAFAFTFTLLAACAPMAEAPETASAPAVTAAAIDLAALREDIETLASDEYEGRMPGTPGGRKTVEYLTRRFAEAGLRPGNQGSWVQEVPLVEIGLEGDPDLIVSGPATQLSFDYKTDMVAVSYRPDAETRLEDSDIVFVGYGINAPERGWNDYEGVDVAGKTVIMLVNDPDWEMESLDGTFEGRAMTYYGRWTYKYEEAARQGAAAAFVVHDTAPASYGWNVVSSSWSGPQHYMGGRDPDAPTTRVNGWVTNEAAPAIMAAPGRDLDALTAAAKRPGFKAVPLGLKASIDFRNRSATQSSHNVIGILPGSERPDEYVIYTAHWDHLGICEANEAGDDICNGARDNATGTAGLIAIADAMRKQGAPERSVVFLAVTAEESGLLGSAYYGANPVYPLARTVGGINMDGLPAAGASRDFVVVGKGKSELEEYLAAVLDARGLELKAEPAPEAGYYYRSDHFSLAKHGVPMLYARPGEDLVEGGIAAGRAAEQAYRAERYHGPEDEITADWDWQGLARDLSIYYAIGRALAETEDWPNWYEGTEFRAIRDESRGGM
ncbi:MAG: M28 family metallopeptidase [Sphingomonadaceae bacterium]